MSKEIDPILIKFAEEGISGIIELFDDPEREGLKDTPKRYIKFLQEFLNPPAFKFTTFGAEEYDEMIVVANIPFFSLCEHHLAPFFGTAAIAYIPKDRIVGLSKLPRALNLYARKFQNQERITAQVAMFIQEQLQPLGVGVTITARHMCMEMRGVKTHDCGTTTCKLLGNFKKPEVKAEFFEHIKRK